MPLPLVDLQNTGTHYQGKPSKPVPCLAQRCAEELPHSPQGGLLLLCHCRQALLQGSCQGLIAGLGCRLPLLKAQQLARLLDLGVLKAPGRMGRLLLPAEVRLPPG